MSFYWSSEQRPAFEAGFYFMIHSADILLPLRPFLHSYLIVKEDKTLESYGLNAGKF